MNLQNLNEVQNYDFRAELRPYVCDWSWAVPLPAGLIQAFWPAVLWASSTVFSPLLEFDIKPTDRVGVVGIGGLASLLRFSSTPGVARSPPSPPSLLAEPQPRTRWWHPPTGSSAFRILHSAS